MSSRVLIVPLAVAQLLLWTGGAAAQTPQSARGGAFTNFPLGMSFAPSPATDEFWIKDPAEDVPPAPWSAPALQDRPNYTLGSIFSDLPDPTDVEIDAASTGNDGLPDFDESGEAIPQGAWWFALTVSINNDTTGQGLFPANDPGADLVTYWFLDSQGIDGSLLGTTHVEQTRGDMGLESTDDIDAFDFGMGIILENPGGGLDAFVPYRNHLYYSVSSQWATDWNINHPLGAGHPEFTPGEGADPAAIYHQQWLGTSWGPRTVYKTRHDLDIDTAFPEDVDAIVVNASTGSVIFSTRKITEDPNRSQLLVIAPSGTKKPLKDGGVEVTVKLNISTDNDVDSACGKDPENVVDPRLAGVPQRSRYSMFPWGMEPMSLSVVRSTDLASSNLVQYHGEIVGWGGATPQASKGIVFLSTDGSNYAPIYKFSRGKTDLTVPFTWPVDLTQVGSATDFWLEAVLFDGSNMPLAATWSSWLMFVP